MVLTKLLAAAVAGLAAGQRQCQPLGDGARCRGVNPDTSMVDPSTEPTSKRT